MAERRDRKECEPGASPRSGKPPPAHSRWKKGQSGNPKGRPCRTPLTDEIREILSQDHQGKALGRLLAERIVKEALAGKHPFVKEIYDRIEGKPPDVPEPERESPAIVFQIVERPTNAPPPHSSPPQGPDAEPE